MVLLAVFGILLAMLVSTITFSEEPSNDQKTANALPPPEEGGPPAGLRVVLAYEQVRELVPFVLPQQPELLDIRPTSPFNCGPLLDDALGDGIPRQNPEEFTVAEMMLAYGWQNPKANEFWSLPLKERISFYKETADTREWAFPCFNPLAHVTDLWWWVLNNMTLDASTLRELLNNSPAGVRFDDPEHRFIEDYLAQFTSPVTGKLIEFKCREFSPGNMYVTFIPDEVIEQHRDFFDSHWEPHVKPEPGDIVYMYYRAYGTTGVIRTGIFFGTPNKMGMLMGRS
ncbi:MAG: hypothetical protein A2Y63_06255 [Candidatus Riflebacteria bacterium RBG_13_59_9]|nr:MAG: hypothetical protein A2Y63_06255 [Candidatus Riflebacteria bacterium RBG_13_59_9]